MQALYFDKSFHNATSAAMWWDKHKAFFDTREQLMQHLIYVSQKALTKFGKRLKRTGAKPRQTSVNPRLGLAAGANRGADTTYANPLHADPARPGLRAR